jgi:hypothetical protein
MSDESFRGFFEEFTSKLNELSIEQRQHLLTSFLVSLDSVKQPLDSKGMQGFCFSSVLISFQCRHSYKHLA